MVDDRDCEGVEAEAVDPAGLDDVVARRPSVLPDPVDPVVLPPDGGAVTVTVTTLVDGSALVLGPAADDRAGLDAPAGGGSGSTEDDGAPLPVGSAADVLVGTGLTGGATCWLSSA